MKDYPLVHDYRMDGGFIDTRLYISVRPFLEYAIADTGTIVLSALLGDSPSSVARNAVEQLRSSTVFDYDRVHTPDELGDINSHFARVINHVIEHVSCIQREWIEFLTKVSTGLHQELKCIRRDALEVRAVYQRYRSTNTEVVEREYRKEMGRLQQRMNDKIEAFRGGGRPQIVRSPALVTSAQELREAFSSAYGTVNTSQLMRLRQFFDGEILRLQVDVRDAFCKSCDAILGIS